MRLPIASVFTVIVSVFALIGVYEPLNGADALGTSSTPQTASKPASARSGTAASATASSPTTRASKPLFKGVELYSWKVPKDESWHFALLPGTNRNKQADEVLNADNRIDGVDALKKHLAEYAPEEQVFWLSQMRDPEGVPKGVEFGRPDKKVVEELTKYCRGLNIKLSIVNIGP